jgi:chromosomal replication initiation ATPase DnaA
MPAIPPSLPRQLALHLAPARSDAREDLIADPSNAEALAWLARPAAWPLGRLALHGPEGVGKTHMLRACAPGWRHLEGAALSEALALAPATATALDNAEAAPEAALFHLINTAAEAGAPLLLAARQPPARWATRLPDLASRLRATLAVAVGHPTEALLAAQLAKHLADRQLRVEAPVQAFLLARLPRSAAALAAAVARLDAAALAEGAAITRPFAARVLGPWLGPLGEADDASATPAFDASPPPPRPG